MLPGCVAFAVLLGTKCEQKRVRFIAVWQNLVGGYLVMASILALLAQPLDGLGLLLGLLFLAYGA